MARPTIRQVAEAVRDFTDGQVIQVGDKRFALTGIQGYVYGGEIAVVAHDQDEPDEDGWAFTVKVSLAR